MTKSLYKSKTRWEEAEDVQKIVSKYDRKRYTQKKIKGNLIKKLGERKAQQIQDHDLLELIKEKYPQQFKICLKKFLFQDKGVKDGD